MGIAIPANVRAVRVHGNEDPHMRQRDSVSVPIGVGRRAKLRMLQLGGEQPGGRCVQEGIGGTCKRTTTQGGHSIGYDRGHLSRYCCLTNWTRASACVMSMVPRRGRRRYC